MEYNERLLEVIDLTLIGTNPTVLVEYIDKLVHDAFIAGYKKSKGVGLSLTVQERASAYCEEKGLRT